MTLASDLVAATKRYLGMSAFRDERDILNGNITNAATTLTSTDSAVGIQTGATIEIDTEKMYVRSVSGATATVLRGQEGTTAAAHTSGALIWVNPKFPTFDILQELNNELASLSSPANGLYKIATVDLTWSGATVGYDLTGVADIEDVLDVSWKDYAFSNWVDVPPTDYELQRNLATTEFASGNALFFRGGVAPGRSVRVRYKAPFTALSALTDDVQTVSGLPATANDIPPLGAAARLNGPREVRRSFLDAQGDPRSGEQVPSGEILNSTSWLLARRRERIMEEASRLSRDYPVQLSR